MVEVVEVVVAVVVTVVGVKAERTQVCLLPDAHALVIGQRNTPVLPSAHNNNTLPTGTARNGATQPEADATETNRVLFNRTNDEASQHNNGAGFDADQNWVPPAHTLLEATRLTTPDDESTHTVTALGKRLASATPPAHKAPTNKTTVIPARLNRFITLPLLGTTKHVGVRGNPHILAFSFDI